jgi:teichuronic acid biosynthesis protein TuaF
LLTNAPFYQEKLTGLWNRKQNEIVSKLQVMNVADDRIKLSYTEHSKENAIQIVNEITRAFLNLDQQKFHEKKNIIQETINTLRQEKVSEDTKVDQQRFLYELNNARLDLKPATLLQPADKENVMIENKAFTSKERAVLGGLLGITFALLVILVPEFVREQS